MTRHYALLGSPVVHSRSPALHNGWFAALRIDADYRAIEVLPGTASSLRRLLLERELSGANLTIPLKQRAMVEVDRLSRIAQAAGSVNTLWWEDGALWGDTTDALGFVRAVQARWGPLDLSRRAVILGAGGAGRAVAAGLAERGLARVVLLNRTGARAAEAAAELAPHYPSTYFESGSLEEWASMSSEAGLVANCVSGQGKESIARLQLGALPTDARWCDLNYWDPAPPHAPALGERFLDGLPMLVEQAALSFERWTGQSPPRPGLV